MRLAGIYTCLMAAVLADFLLWKSADLAPLYLTIGLCACFGQSMHRRVVLGTALVANLVGLLLILFGSAGNEVAIENGSSLDRLFTLASLVLLELFLPGILITGNKPRILEGASIHFETTMSEPDMMQMESEKLSDFFQDLKAGSSNEGDAFDTGSTVVYDTELTDGDSPTKLGYSVDESSVKANGKPGSGSGESQHRVLRKFGDFELLKLLGTGGSSHVFQARQVSTGQQVALKIMSKEYTQPRFQREMGIVERLNHPNIVVAYESGVVDGRMFISMELVDGLNLSQIIRRDGPLDPQTALKYLYQAATGLEHAHQRNLVHRDVKPANFLIAQDSILKLSDLGLARQILDEDRDQKYETRRGVIGGTIEFMSPEQALALNEADEKSDIYSLGAMTFYLLTGETYLRGHDFKTLFRNLTVHQEFREIEESGLDPDGVQLLKKMLQYDPEDRIQNCSELRDEIQKVLTRLGCASPDQTVRVLVVEDDESDLLATLRYLRRTNRSVETVEAQSFREARKALTEEKFNLILLDLNLPDTRGLETVERIQEINTQGTPLIVLTGLPDDILESNCRKLGANDFISKDQFDVRHLERQIFVAMSKFGSPTL